MWYTIRELKPRLSEARGLLGNLKCFLDLWEDIQDDQEQKPFEEVWEEFDRYRYLPHRDKALIKETAQRLLEA